MVPCALTIEQLRLLHTVDLVSHTVKVREWVALLNTDPLVLTPPVGVDEVLKAVKALKKAAATA